MGKKQKEEYFRESVSAYNRKCQFYEQEWYQTNFSMHEEYEGTELVLVNSNKYLKYEEGKNEIDEQSPAPPQKDRHRL